MFQRVLYCKNASFLLTVVIVARGEREKRKIILSRSWFHLVSICLLYICIWFDLGFPIPRSQEFIQKVLRRTNISHTSRYFWVDDFLISWICDTLSWSVLEGNTISIYIPEANMFAPENVWLENKCPFLLGLGLFEKRKTSLRWGWIIFQPVPSIFSSFYCCC